MEERSSSDSSDQKDGKICLTHQCGLIRLLENTFVILNGERPLRMFLICIVLGIEEQVIFALNKTFLALHSGEVKLRREVEERQVGSVFGENVAR